MSFRRNIPSEVLEAICESFNPGPGRRPNGHANDMEGYRIHINPDDSCVWLEGYDMRHRHFPGEEVGPQLNACIKKRGLTIERGYMGYPSMAFKMNPNHPLRNFKRWNDIAKLENEFFGDWAWG